MFTYADDFGIAAAGSEDHLLLLEHDIAGLDVPESQALVESK